MIRTATLGAVCVAAAAVVATAVSLSDQRVRTVSAERPSSSSYRAAVTADIPQLHHLSDPIGLPKRSRNLFAFGATGATPAMTVAATAPAPAEAVETPRSVLPVVFKLLGIAEDAGPGGTTRTAIISGSGELFLVKEGDSVTDRYRVSIILPDAADLSDVIGGTTLRLGLK